MNSRLPSIQRRILSSILLAMLVVVSVLTIAFGLMNSRLLQTMLTDRMDLAMQVAWDLYNEGPNQLVTTIQSLAELPDFRSTELNQDSMQRILSSLNTADFAAVVGNDLRVIAHTNESQVGHVAPFSHMVDQALRTGAVQISTEQIDADWVSTQMPGLLSRFGVPLGCTIGSEDCIAEGLVQVVVVPVSLSSGKGVVIAGILLNNTNRIPQAVSDSIPGSYLSIAEKGFRVSSNINTASGGPLTTGSHQSYELVNTIDAGQRYYGPVSVGTESHYVVSDPIYNSYGRVIGALSVGLPPNRYAIFQCGTHIMIPAFALLAIIVSFLVARTVSRPLARPIISLEKDVMQLASANGVRELQQAASQMQPANSSLYSQEVQNLHNSLHILAKTLVDLTSETEAFVHQMEDDKAELKALTEELQESKVLLEKKVEERTKELKQAVLDLRRANHLKSQFLSTMSHELRTPLNSIIGFSEMLVDELVGPLTAKQREYLDQILLSARHLLQLISDILDLSRIEQGRMNLDMQQVLLQELVASVATRVTPQAEAAGLTLEVESDPTVPAIQADPTRIQEILDNLLSNAIKFTPSGGMIWMRLRRDETMAILEVEDTGIGMKPEDQEIVFNEFVQAESAHHRRFEGVGLGLPLSKKLAEMHGGRIELTSALETGTCVRVYLPLGKGEKG